MKDPKKFAEEALNIIFAIATICIIATSYVIVWSELFPAPLTIKVLFSGILTWIYSLYIYKVWIDDGNI